MNLFNDLWIARDGATECKSPVGRSRFINQMMWLLCAVFTFFIKYRNVDRYTMTTLKALQAYVQGLQNRSLSHRFHGYQSLPWAGGGLLVFLMRKNKQMFSNCSPGVPYTIHGAGQGLLVLLI